MVSSHLRLVISETYCWFRFFLVEMLKQLQKSRASGHHSSDAEVRC
jgi:hypothetical protein